MNVRFSDRGIRFERAPLEDGRFRALCGVVKTAIVVAGCVAAAKYTAPWALALLGLFALGGYAIYAVMKE